MGDTHGEWGLLNTFLNKKKPDILIVCGDFGHWPGNKFTSYKKIKNPNTKIYWCDGNHENHHDLLERLNRGDPRRILAVGDNIYHVPRGRILDLPFLGNTMFIGGAFSVDKEWRTPGLDWFPEEILREVDIDWIPANVTVDTVVSHTSPTEFCPHMYNEKLQHLPWHRDKSGDPSQEVLSKVLWKYKPKNWFYGHYHTFDSGKHGPTDTHWQALGHIGGRYQNFVTFSDEPQHRKESQPGHVNCQVGKLSIS